MRANHKPETEDRGEMEWRGGRRGRTIVMGNVGDQERDV